MSGDNAAAIAVLMQELDLLNRHPEVMRRDSILNAIEVLKGNNSSAERYQSAASSRRQKRVVPSPPKPTSKGREPKGRRGYRVNSNGEPSVASLLAEAGKAQAGDFTIADLRAYLDKHYPARSAQLSNDDMSKQVYILRERGQFILAKAAPKNVKGGMNTYRHNDQYLDKK